MILITGATGFLGMSLVARLLEDEDGPNIVLPVRARDRGEALDRVEAMLATLYDDVPASAERLRAVPGDILDRGLGLAPADVRGVERVVHCAASISFTLPLPEAREINVSGTANVVELCRRLPSLERYVHVSTAYVAGRSSGTFAETDFDVGQTFRNTYEQTKWEAEYLVARADLPTAVVRPSIVVGEAGSGWTPAFNVIYWPLQAFARGLVESVPADPRGLVDLVPIDHVVNVLQRAMEPDAENVLHAVAGEMAPSVDELLDLTSTLLDRPRPELTDPGSDPDHPAAVFAPYFDVGVCFADARTRAAGLVAPGAPELVASILDYAREARWGKSPLSRQTARARVLTA